jgi:hypothetical protein
MKGELMIVTLLKLKSPALCVILVDLFFSCFLRDRVNINYFQIFLLGFFLVAKLRRTDFHLHLKSKGVSHPKFDN